MDRYNEVVQEEVLSEAMMVDYLTQLNFIDSQVPQELLTQIWYLLNQNQQAQKLSLCHFLLAVQNINAYEKPEKESFYDGDGVLIIGKDDQKYIFQHFHLLSKTRLYKLHQESE